MEAAEETKFGTKVA